METNLKKRTTAPAMIYMSRPWCPPFLRIHLCEFSSLVLLLLLGSGIASAQVKDNTNLYSPVNIFDSICSVSYADINSNNFKFADGSMVCKGSANITESDGSMSLTSPVSHVADPVTGRCRFKNSFQFANSFSNNIPFFSTMFSFNTLTPANVGQGQGFTFYIGPTNIDEGESGLYLGWLNSTTAADESGHNFAVEFDIFQNSEVNDPNNHHVGINVNSLVSTYKQSFWPAEQGSQPLSLTSNSNLSILYVWIEYHGQDATIDVRMSRTGNRPCSSLIYESLNLTNVLNQYSRMYVGFSSSTGDNSTNSQTTIFDWSFNTIGRRTAANIFGRDEYCETRSKQDMKWILILCTGVIAVLVVLMLFALFFLRRRTKRISELETALSEIQNMDHGPHEFTFRELSRATNRFSDKEILGAGGFGIVYKGTLSRDGNRERTSGKEERLTENSPRIVAVKKMKNPSIASTKEYVAEVKIIGRLRHLNLVRLLGWCHERNELLLVYEYMPNNNLQELLFKKNRQRGGGEVLSWEKRHAILRGVAAALVYLHEECEQRVVHRDVKSSNVMLDKNFNPRLGDFGLARSYDHNEASFQSTTLAGTIGYMAPESLVRGNSTSQSDVYSFGALVLEVASGRSPTYGDDGLANWVRRLKDEDKLLDAVDERLGEKYNREQMEKVLTLGIFCCLHDPDARPTMRQAHAVLQEVESPPQSKLTPVQAYDWGGLHNINGSDSSYSTSIMIHNSPRKLIGRLSRQRS